MKLGLIGLGIMGQPIALNLLKAGFPLTVFNRTKAKCAPVVSLGAFQVASPKEVAVRSDVVITMVSDTPDVESVLFGEDGVWYGLHEGTVIVDMSTISPNATLQFASRLAGKKCDMLDAPVSGGAKGAIEGTLSIMVGGKPEIFEKCLSIFNAVAKNIVYTGSNGNGQKTKLTNQVVVALNLLATVEGLRLAQAFNLDLVTTHRAISGGAASSWMFTNLGSMIIGQNFSPGFSIKLQQKDLRIVCELIAGLKEPFPGTQLSYSLLTQALQSGLGDQGTQSLIKLWDTSS